MKISVFNYMDVRQFLQDFYNEQKQSDKKFSYAIWASDLGFSNKTLLRLILQGKRQITAKSCEQFISSLKLDTKEAEYFETLIDFNQAPTAAARQTAGSRLIQIQRKNYIREQVPIDPSVLQDVYGPVLLVAISSAEFALSKEDIAKIFPLSMERIESLLDILLKNQLIEEKKGFYTALQSTFKIADHFGHQALRNFYTHWIRESVNAIDLPPETRRFRSLQLALTPQEFEEVTKTWNEYVTSLLSQVEKNTLTDRRVYMMNTALFPVTH